MYIQFIIISLPLNLLIKLLIIYRYLNRIRKVLSISHTYFRTLQCLDLDEHQDLVYQMELTFKKPLVQKIKTESTFVQKPSWFSNKGLFFTLISYSMMNRKKIVIY